MPSPSDVILVLSPRMATLIQQHLYYSPATEVIERAGFSTRDEGTTAIAALQREIDAQLSREATEPIPTDLREDVLPIADPGQSPAAEIADKMAKAARGAVEGDLRGEDDGTQRKPAKAARDIEAGELVTADDLAELSEEIQRAPGVAPPDSEVQ